MKKLFYNYFYNVSISKKFLLGISLLLLVQIFVINIYIRSNTSSLASQSAQSASQQFLEQYMDNIDFRLSKFDTLLASFSTDKKLRQLFALPEPSISDYKAIEQEIRSILENQFPYAMYALTFYPTNQQPLYYTGSFIRELTPPNQDWMTEMINLNAYRYFMHVEQPFNVHLLTAIRPIYAEKGNEIVCYVKLSLFPEKVFRVIKQDANNPDQIFLIDRNGEFVYSETENTHQDYFSYLSSHYAKIYASTDIAKLTTKDGIFITSRNSTHGYRSVYFLTSEEELSSVQSLNRIYVLSTLGLILLMGALASAMSISLNRRLRITMNKIKHFGDGDMSILPAQDGKDEIAVFDQSFTSMAQEVKQLINDKYIGEMQKKNAELLALQAQINPHFLFNSLEIINSLIEVDKPDTASEAIGKLSDLLRYAINTRSSSIVTLREEINNVNNYIYIQHLRFGESFSFETDIDPDCLSYNILKLTLQPIIENSLRHGLDRKSHMTIHFSLLDLGTQLQIVIRDNGIGMAEPDFQKLLYKLEKTAFDNLSSPHGSIGILNIHHRMKLKYGDAYTLQIQTAPGAGMTTCITIPKE